MLLTASGYAPHCSFFFAFPVCRDKHSKCLWPSLCVGLLICLTIPAYGLYRLCGDSPASGESVDALFVEGNVDQNTKWDPIFQRDTLNHYMALSLSGLAAARGKGVNNPLIIWPETAMPFFYQSRPEMVSIIRNFTREVDCPLLFGAPGLEKIAGEDEPVVFNRRQFARQYFKYWTFPSTVWATVMKADLFQKLIFRILLPKNCQMDS